MHSRITLPVAVPTYYSVARQGARRVGERRSLWRIAPRCGSRENVRGEDAADPRARSRCERRRDARYLRHRRSAYGHHGRAYR